MTEEKTSLLEFPCHFPIKILGINSEDLIAEVVAVVSRHCNDFDPEDDIKTTPSKKGNYISVTANINATSQTQIDAIYMALSKHELVKFTL
jgi:uncharacterized protein